MQYTQLLFEVRDSVASITLNRPEILNALNLELARDLMNVAMECSGNRDVRAVVLSGAGSAFCAGGDLKSFAAQGERLPAYVTEVATYLHAAVSYLTRMQAPVIAAVQGSAAGAGMSLACACDLICAGKSARFTAAYTRIGLTPDGSLTYFLSRAVGMKRALELTLLKRTLSAEEAYHWGNRYVHSAGRQYAGASRSAGKATGNGTNPGLWHDQATPASGLERKPGDADDV